MIELLTKLDAGCKGFDVEQIIQLLRNAPTEFNYQSASSDLVHIATSDVNKSEIIPISGTPPAEVKKNIA